MALLTLQYTAPLPVGFTSGTVEVKSGAVYIDAAGRVNQPYKKYTLNADKSLTSLQGDATPVIVGMAMGDPNTALPLDVVVTHNVTGLPTPLRSTFRVTPVDVNGTGTLNLHAPSLTAPVVGPYSPTLQALIDGATGQQVAVGAAITGANTAAAGANAAAAAVPGTVATALVPITQALADSAQATALAAAVAGIVGRANLAAITGADGYYRAMDTGYVYQRSSGVNTRRVDLEAVSASAFTPVDLRSSRLYSVSQQAGADPTTRLRAAQQAAGAVGGLVFTNNTVGTDNWTANAPRAAEFIYGDPLSLSTYATDHRAGRSVFGGRLFQNTALQAGDNGYLGYLERLEATVQGRTVSTVTAYIGMNSLATGTGVITEANRTNQVALVVNAGASTTGASAGIEGLNVLASSAFTGTDYQPVIGIEVDMSAARTAGYFGELSKSYSIGSSMVWNSPNFGTAAYVTSSGTQNQGWLHGAYISGVLQVGLSIWSSALWNPSYGMYVSGATTAGLFIGAKLGITGAIGHNSQDLPTYANTPPVGVWHGARAATSGRSIPARWTATDGTGVETHWDLDTDSFLFTLAKNGTTALQFAPNALWAGGTQVVGTRKTGWALATGTKSRATFDASTVTLVTLAQVVAAIQQDIASHGLIGA
jgi:hypothetical protein